MPLTFVDIERQKSWRISVLFVFLVILYFLFAFIIFHALACYFPVFFIASGSFFALQNLKYFAFIAFAAFFVATIHFVSSGLIAVQRVIEQVGGRDPDPEDGIHKQLMNIMNEVQIAAGNEKKVRCMVIPTLSTNALSVTDLRGDAVIAITEGLLSRLSRPQLEAVIAHEAYHVLSGDCLEASLATSLFGIYASAFDRVGTEIKEDARAWPVAFVAWVLVSLGNMLNMFISREREYRADAGAVRMTRDPVSLAEALDLISKRWAGTGFISDGLEMLCISSPSMSGYDESEGWWDNLMSTHPPIGKRIDVLLRMAHVSASVLGKSETRKVSSQTDSPEPLFYALDPENMWLGPFRIAELATFQWFSPLTWISTIPGGKAERVSGLSSLDGIFSGRIPVEGAALTGMRCPSCRQPLERVSYEKTMITRCPFCQGTLVDSDKIPRILARSDNECSERILSLVKAVTADSQRSLTIRRLRQAEKKKGSFISCPKCGRQMFRTFYSYAYLMEIDRCGICGVTWFDADELEMLQCIIGDRNHLMA